MFGVVDRASSLSMKICSEILKYHIKDEENFFSYHDNNIANIIKAKGTQIYYQVDKDWFYRSDERRWNVLNDMSSWRKNESDGKKIKKSIYHLW